jgi:predicted amidohydrolase YtcJ
LLLIVLALAACGSAPDGTTAEAVAVLISDVFAQPPKGPDDIKVAATIFDGRVVYARPQATGAD